VYGQAVPERFSSDVRVVDDTRRAFEARAPQILAQINAAAWNQSINVLAVSGGSVGAGTLIAPFAFLGPAWDKQLIDVFSGTRTRNLLQLNFMGALFEASIYRGKPLLEMVDRYVTAELLRAVAAESAKGRKLLVATTDLDKEQTVIWNLGVIAAQGGEGARRLFRDIVVASASIPGIFPPVLIRVTHSGTVFDEMTSMAARHLRCLLRLRWPTYCLLVAMC
jgi:patatin-like phospholipase/acyl hydrolase